MYEVCVNNAELSGQSGGRLPRPTVSAELFAIPVESGLFILYAPLRRAAIVANLALLNWLAELQAGVAESVPRPDDRLLDFLRRIEILDGGPEVQPITEYSGDPQPTALTLFLTTACNLRCTYCYASAGDTPARFMDLEIAKRGIDLVCDNAVAKSADHIEVTFHGGGEPTVHWKVLVAALEYARDRAAGFGLKMRAFSGTNGVLTDAQTTWVIENLDGVGVSFDGLPRVHDRNRLTVLGQGSSERVMKTLRRFDEAGFPYGLRITVTAEQIPDLPDSVAFVCSSFRPKRIQVEPAYQLGRWANAPSAETGGFVAAFRRAQAVALGRGSELFFSGARVGLLTNHFCGTTRDAFALTPDGEVSGCYEAFSKDNPLAKYFFYGESAGSGFRFDLPVLSNLRRQAVQYRDYCAGCYAKWTCGGDCYHKALAANGGGEFAGTERCHIIRELTKDQVAAKIIASGGLFWHEGGMAATPTADDLGGLL